MSCYKVSAFYRLFFAKERRKVLKEKCDGNLQCDFFAACQIVLPVDFPTTSFDSHVIV